MAITHDTIEAEANNIQPPMNIEPSDSPEESHSPNNDPYLNLGCIGIGMTGLVHELEKDRVVKKAKHYDNQKYMNEINQHSLENEIRIYKRLGHHKGIIHCFKTSQYGIELARAQGDLEDYLGNNPEPKDSLKINWMSSLGETLSYIHSRKIFVDDMALRNILILDGQLQLADFGQSVLFPLETNMDSADDEGLNVWVEILHLGWILYSIASWTVHKYDFFVTGWPESDSLPNVDDVLCGGIIVKCWRGEYTSMDQVKDEICQLLIQ